MSGTISIGLKRHRKDGAVSHSNADLALSTVFLSVKPNFAKFLLIHILTC
jgi:hypothetical protein